MTSKDYSIGQSLKQNDVIFVADFETSKNENKTWVYLWSVSPLNSDIFYNGYDIASFIKFIREHTGRYYFHNAKFDVSFIISFLLKNGFIYSEKKTPNSIQTLYSGNGNFYSCKINFSYTDKRNKKINTFLNNVKQDVLKNIPTFLEDPNKQTPQNQPNPNLRKTDPCLN